MWCVHSFGLPCILLLSFCTQAAFGQVNLPWNGRFASSDLVSNPYTKQYMTHIITMGNHRKGGVKDYLELIPNSRIPSYNNDTASVQIKVDPTSIFTEQLNFRRTEIVQILPEPSEGKGVAIDGSFLKHGPFLNKIKWQSLFDEGHAFEIRFDATESSTKLCVMQDGGGKVAFDEILDYHIWYNFRILISQKDIRVMMSKNDEALKEVASYATNRYASGSIEVHAGLLAYFNSAEQAEAYVTQSDYIEFNGLSAKFF